MKINNFYRQNSIHTNDLLDEINFNMPSNSEACLLHISSEVTDIIEASNFNLQSNSEASLIQIPSEKMSILESIKLNVPSNSENSLIHIPSEKKLLIKRNNVQSPGQKKLTNVASNMYKTNSKSNDQLAQILLNENLIVMINGTLFHWNDTKRYYIGMTSAYTEKFIRQKIPQPYKNKINSNTIREIVLWIKASENIEVNPEALLKKQDYIAFRNGIYNTLTRKKIPHDSNFYFTSIINANYSPNSSGEVFEKFMQSITKGNKNLYLLIQEMFGYVISEIRNIKCILYLLGPKDTGKSIVLRLLEYLVGKEASSSLSFEQLSSPDYLVKLLGKRLNLSGETSELTLKRLDILKKLSGGDTLTVRGIYEQPIDFVNSAALVFAGNHLPKIKGNDSHNAFTERLVIIPLENAIPKNQQDIYLFDKLCEEIDYIAYWSIFGFHRWKNNNFEFTQLPEVIAAQNNYKKKADTIRNFLQEKCIFDTNLSIYSDELLKAYEIYCKGLGTIPRSDKEFHGTLKTFNNLKYTRFRMDKENKNGYKGLQLKSNFSEE